jgi:hypothetical protein
LSCNCVLFCFGERKYFGYIAGGRRKNGSASNLIRLFDRTVRAETPSTACATERRPRIVRRADYAHTMWHPSHRVSVSTITLLVSKWRSTRSLAFNYSFFRSMWVMSYTLQPEMREAATTHYDCTCFISSLHISSTADHPPGTLKIFLVMRKSVGPIVLVFSLKIMELISGTRSRVSLTRFPFSNLMNFQIQTHPKFPLFY